MVKRELLWTVYMIGDKILLPTVAKTQAGYYLDVEPVEVAALGDHEAVTRALIDVMRRGNPTVPTPTRTNFPKPVVLQYADIKNWTAFANKSKCWSIEKYKQGYEIVPQDHEKDGWVADRTRTISIPRHRSLEEDAEAIAKSIGST